MEEEASVPMLFLISEWSTLLHLLELVPFPSQNKLQKDLDPSRVSLKAKY